MKIKRLKWQIDKGYDDIDAWIAPAIWVNGEATIHYYVNNRASMDSYHVYLISGRVSYSIAKEVGSLELGKQKAQEHFEKIIKVVIVGNDEKIK